MAAWSSDMFPLAPQDMPSVRELYSRHDSFFPLIGAVIEGAQDGVVYVDDPASPRQAYVEHHFGFAQVFGRSNSAFERALETYLVSDRRFVSPKVRLYGPTHPQFLDQSHFAAIRSERQRFCLGRDRTSAGAGSAGAPAICSMLPVVPETLDQIEQTFGVITRFWRTGEDFLKHAHAVVASADEDPAAICYAAATAGGRAEIDVITLPPFRMQGLGRLVVERFVAACLAAGIEPVWDCFTNNAGSMSLARAAGFAPAAPPYPFFTFTK
jgi:hypothetical protein